MKKISCRKESLVSPVAWEPVGKRTLDRNRLGEKADEIEEATWPLEVLTDIRHHHPDIRRHHHIRHRPLDIRHLLDRVVATYLVLVVETLHLEEVPSIEMAFLRPYWAGELSLDLDS